jgi:hypothetical protein
MTPPLTGAPRCRERRVKSWQQAGGAVWLSFILQAGYSGAMGNVGDDGPRNEVGSTLRRALTIREESSRHPNSDKLALPNSPVHSGTIFMAIVSRPAPADRPLRRLR